MLYAKIVDGAVVEFPITGTDIVLQNPGTSFPAGELSAEVMAAFECLPVVETPQPAYDYTQNITRSAVLVEGAWVEVWTTTAASPQEIMEREAQQMAQREAQRAAAYRDESDPIFFMSQRGEATQQEWLDKVAEIKARYP
jgi:hypothetical protein